MAVIDYPDTHEQTAPTCRLRICRYTRDEGDQPRFELRRSGRAERRPAIARGARGSEREHVLAWISRPEGVWQCTTCMACLQACPAEIELVPAIIEERRMLVEKGELDPLLQQALQNVAVQGNAYGKSARRRARWTKGLDFAIPDARKEAVHYVWFVGDHASFDERVQDASRRLAKILHDAGVSFGQPFERERNSATTCAAPARRACSRCSPSTTRRASGKRSSK